MGLDLRGRKRMPLGEWEIARYIDWPTNVWVDLGPRPPPPKKRDFPFYVGEKYDANDDVWYLPGPTGLAEVPALYCPHPLIRD